MAVSWNRTRDVLRVADGTERLLVLKEVGIEDSLLAGFGESVFVSLVGAVSGATEF